jgi:hypothetical protein
MEAIQVVVIAEEEARREKEEAMIEKVGIMIEKAEIMKEIGHHINSKIRIAVMKNKDMINIMIISTKAEALWADASKRLIKRKEIIMTDFFLLFV